jgi:cytidylate kinase
MSNYDLCIDAEKFGIEETANMIINAAKKKIK